jgi:hypothetical protein
MRSYKALVSEDEIIVVDDLCTGEELMSFMYKHRLHDIKVVEWNNSLDLEDNGYGNLKLFVLQLN